MTDIYGPWYTLGDAAVHLETTETDLLHQIAIAKLRPILYAKGMRVMCCSADDKGRLTGHAHFKYHGPLLADVKLVQGLAKLRPGPFYSLYRPLDWEGVSAYSTSYPYQESTPTGILEAWSPKSLAELQAGRRFGFIGLPREGQDLKSVLREIPKIFENNGTNLANDMLATIQSVESTYDWYAEGAWEAEDFRIPKSELARVRSSAEQKMGPEITSPFPRELPRERRHQLRELIFAILQDNPRQNTQDVWRILKSDCGSPEPQYDKLMLLIRVEREEILWRSEHDNEQKMSRKTLANTVSDLKKELR